MTREDQELVEHSDRSFPTGEGIDFLIELVNDEYDAEGSRKESLERRTQFVLTSSAALVTVLLGIGGFEVQSSNTAYDEAAVGIVIGAVFALALVAILCLRANDILAYDHPDLEDVERTLSEEWTSLEKGRAQILATKAKLAALYSARRNNGLKANKLAWAIRFETAGIVLLGLAAGLTMLGSLFE